MPSALAISSLAAPRLRVACNSAPEMMVAWAQGGGDGGDGRGVGAMVRRKRLKGDEIAQVAHAMR